jgi:hypothetical protein
MKIAIHLCFIAEWYIGAGIICLLVFAIAYSVQSKIKGRISSVPKDHVMEICKGYGRKVPCILDFDTE